MFGGGGLNSSRVDVNLKAREKRRREMKAKSPSLNYRCGDRNRDRDRDRNGIGCSCRLLLQHLGDLRGSGDASTLSRRRRVGGQGGGEGRCCTRGRGGGQHRGLARGRGVSGGRGFSVSAVVHLEDVLLDVSDPVLLHRHRAVELHVTEPEEDKPLLCSTAVLSAVVLCTAVLPVLDQPLTGTSGCRTFPPV